MLFRTVNKVWLQAVANSLESNQGPWSMLQVKFSNSSSISEKSTLLTFWVETSWTHYITQYCNSFSYTQLSFNYKQVKTKQVKQVIDKSLIIFFFKPYQMFYHWAIVYWVLQKHQHMPCRVGLLLSNLEDLVRQRQPAVCLSHLRARGIIFRCPFFSHSAQYFLQLCQIII